jgi:hypothetical protein
MSRGKKKERPRCSLSSSRSIDWELLLAWQHCFSSDTVWGCCRHCLWRRNRHQQLSRRTLGRFLWSAEKDQRRRQTHKVDQIFPQAVKTGVYKKICQESNGVPGMFSSLKKTKTIRSKLIKNGLLQKHQRKPVNEKKRKYSEFMKCFGQGCNKKKIFYSIFHSIFFKT